LRFLGGLFVFLLFSDVFASEIVKVRLFTTSKPQIKIYENLSIKQIVETKDLKSPLEFKSENLSVDAQSVPDHIILYPKNGDVEVIAVLDMEDYLRGVLPHEMPLLWPIEALKAQAVVARSFTKRQMLARKDKSFHLDSTVNDQVYRYNQSFSAKEKENLKIDLEETQDEILENSSGNPVKTLYYADCGEQTEKYS